MRCFRRSIRRHIVSCVAIVCAGVLAASLVRSSHDATQVRNDAHAVQLAAATLNLMPTTNVVVQHRHTDQVRPSASALPAGVGVVAFFLVAFSPLIVGLVVCALCVAAVYAINFTGLILDELTYRLRHLPPIAAARKASAATTKKATGTEPPSAARSKRPNHTPSHAKPATVGPAKRSTSKPAATNALATRAHSARASAARAGR